MHRSQPRKKEKVERTAEEEEDEDEEDPFDRRIRESGCSAQHYALQDCMEAKKMWTECQAEVNAFKTCVREQAATRTRAVARATGSAAERSPSPGK